MCPGPTFDRVFVALKAQLIAGRLAPGDHLEPTAIGESLFASITPVRDALHRLVGERIVEAPRNDGFRVPAPTEAELRDLYGWNGRLLDLALARQVTTVAQPQPEAGRDRSGTVEATGQLFRLIARRSASLEHEAAVATLNDRLGAMRHAEPHVFEDVEEELKQLSRAFATRDWPRLRRALAVYHRRRRQSVPEILVAARAGANRTSETIVE